LDFLEIKFFKGYFAPPFQISQKSLKPLQRYRDFCDFQDGVRRHFGLSKIRIFKPNAQNGKTFILSRRQVVFLGI